MFTTSLKRAGLALAAITGLGLAGCGDDPAPEATFLPGDYVAGAVFDTQYFPEGAKDIGMDDDRFGALEINVAEDGAITGTFMDYTDWVGNIGFVTSKDLPIGIATDSEYDVSGTAEGTSFSVALEDTPDDVEIMIEGTITPDGFISGEMLLEGDLVGHVGGIVTNDENVAIACGWYWLSNNDDVYSDGRTAFISRGESELFGVFYDFSAQEGGLFEGTFDNTEEEGAGTMTGTFDDVDLEAIAADIHTVYLMGDGFLYVNGGFTGDFSNSGFFANTDHCYNWNE